MFTLTKTIEILEFMGIKLPNFYIDIKLWEFNLKRYDSKTVLLAVVPAEVNISLVVHKIDYIFK